MALVIQDSDRRTVMKCTSCGYQTQPNAKFCVQCGTTLPSAAAAPVAAASATVISAAPKAAAAPSLAPPPMTPTSTQRLAAATYAPAPAPTPTASAAAGALPPATPRRWGLIAGLVGALAVLCAGGFLAYKMLLSDDSKPSVASTEPKAMEGTATRPADASKDASAPGAPQAPTGTDNSPAALQSPTTAPVATDSKATATATPQPTPGATAPKAGPASPKVDAAAGAKGAATPAPAVSPAPATPPRQTAAAAPVASATQPDRWEQMRQAYEVCNRESLFDRLACNQRVGQQYCKGYWGLVPQCPTGAYGDRANN
jgi:hypothetical protein